MLHYIGDKSFDGPSGTRAVVFEEERAAWQWVWYDRCNAACCSSFSKTDEAPE